MDKNNTLNEYKSCFGFDIMPYTSIVRFNSGEYIIREGQEVSRLYYMAEGKAKVYLTHKNGKVSLLNFCEPPCFIGEMELIDMENYPKGVQALFPCICFSIDVASCREKLLDDSRFLMSLCRFMAKKSLENTKNYAVNQSYPLENRLAAFILMTEQRGVYNQKHTETAEYLGVSYRHLLFVLADFCKKGYIEKTVQGYAVRNMEYLEKLAKDMRN